MAKKLASTFGNMLIVLSSICIVSALALGFTYGKTKDAIAKVAQEKKVKNIKKVLEGIRFNNDPTKEMYTVEGFDGLELYPATQDGQPAGVAVKTFSPEGYSGNIWIMVGFKPDGVINAISVVEHKETPGLGTKMDSPWKDQFTGKDPASFKLKVRKDGGDVDAITAATISSRAFSGAVQKAYDAFRKGGAK